MMRTIAMTGLWQPKLAMAPIKHTEDIVKCFLSFYVVSCYGIIKFHRSFGVVNCGTI